MALHRIHPDPTALDPAEAISGLRWGENAPAERPYLALNMVATADGKAAVEGRTRAISSETDRQILTMWLNGTQHSVIAWDLGMTPAAVRQRWKTIRDRLKESLRLGAI